MFICFSICNEPNERVLQDYHAMLDVPIRVYADFECRNQAHQTNPQHQPHRAPFEQVPVAVGYCLIAPWGCSNFLVIWYRRS